MILRAILPRRSMILVSGIHDGAIILSGFFEGVARNGEIDFVFLDKLVVGRGVIIHAHAKDHTIARGNALVQLD